MLKVLSWNLAHRPELWRALSETRADIGLVQEACKPPTEIVDELELDNDPWVTEGAGLRRPWRTAVVQLNRQIEMRRYQARSICDARPGDLAVSRMGTLAAADVRDPESDEVFTVISMYACWEKPHESVMSGWIYADASAHRLISDLSVFIGQQRGHRIIAAGDLNILYGHGEHGSGYWGSRYQTVFDRMEAIGLRFLGPQSPGGEQADPWPAELPHGSRNVPTYRTDPQAAASATRQLDFVFASEQIADRVKVRAMNTPEEWGLSDHCRVMIELH
jgi:hypothetical protein